MYVKKLPVDGFAIGSFEYILEHTCKLKTDTLLTLVKVELFLDGKIRRFLLVTCP